MKNFELLKMGKIQLPFTRWYSTTSFWAQLIW